MFRIVVPNTYLITKTYNILNHNISSGKHSISPMQSLKFIVRSMEAVFLHEDSEMKN